MNDVAELKKYVAVHAAGQGMAGYATVLGRISHDGQGQGAWVTEWSAEAERLAAAGRHLDACRHHIMARFPYVDGPARQTALERGVAELDLWRQGKDIHRLDIELDGGRLACWQTGLSTTDRRPLLLIMGGNVSVKEQWAPALLPMRRLGMAAIVLDMPGCGENTLPYDAASPAMLSSLLDAVADRADVTQTYALALSFSGHMALRCAVADRRIRGVATVGAPVNGFFTDRDWQARVPRITTDALAHMTGTSHERLAGELRGWAITADELAALDIPVAYVASLRDEVIPPGERQLLRDRVRRLELLEFDDVHAAPGHVAETRIWLVRSLLRMRRAGVLPRMVAGLLWHGARLRALTPR